MTRVIYLRPEAEADLVLAADWYENQSAGLGHKFLAEIMRVLDRVAESPGQFPVVLSDTRRALAHRFPFSIYFHKIETEIVVFAVLHQAQSQERWKSRK